MRTAVRTAWDVLGVSPSASPAEVKRAFAARVRAVHPDTGADPAAAPERLAELIEARDIAVKLNSYRRAPAAGADTDRRRHAVDATVPPAPDTAAGGRPPAHFRSPPPRPGRAGRSAAAGRLRDWPQTVRRLAGAVRRPQPMP